MAISKGRMSSSLVKGMLYSFVTKQVVMSSRMEIAKLLAVCLLESSVENDDKIKLFPYMIPYRLQVL